MTPFGISIGNLPVLIETTNIGITDFIRQNFQGFIAPGISDQCARFGLWRIAARLSREKRMSKTSPPYAVNFRRRGNFVLLSRDDFSATLNLTKKTCGVCLKSPDLVDVFLRVFYSTVGVDNHTVLLHAAGLKYKGTAHLFVAPPMGGKTTIVKNARADEVFSDELVLLSKPNGCWRAYSTPFGGSFPAKVSFNSRISAIWFLHKSNVCAASTVVPVDCARQLLRNVLFFSRNALDHGNVLELVSDLVASVPAKKLKFMRNTEVTKCIDTVKRQPTEK